MTTKVIRRWEASWNLSTVMPSSWGTVSACNVAVYDTTGTELVAPTEDAVIKTADTTAALIAAGAETMTLTTGGAAAFVAGEPIRFGSATEGWHFDYVRDYTSTGKVLEPQDIIARDYASGIAVQHRTMTYDLDTDTLANWDDLQEVVVEWIPNSDDLPYRETWAVLSYKADSSDLEGKFKIAFGRYYEEIQPEHFDDFATGSRDYIKMLFKGRGRDPNKMVDNQMLDRITMYQIAIDIAVSKGDEFDAELKKLKVEFKELLAVIDSLNIWIDENEDGVQDEEEFQPALAVGISRGL